MEETLLKWICYLAFNIFFPYFLFTLFSTIYSKFQVQHYFPLISVPTYQALFYSKEIENQQYRCYRCQQKNQDRINDYQTLSGSSFGSHNGGVIPASRLRQQLLLKGFCHIAIYPSFLTSVQQRRVVRLIISENYTNAEVVKVM